MQESCTSPELVAAGFRAPHPTASKKLRTEQRDLAAAVQVTESYISQLLTGTKPPRAPDRTDIYGKMETFLRHCVLTDRQSSRDERNATVPFRTSSPLRIQYSHIADQKNKETCR